MKTATDLHHTNETVEEAGKYVCAAGESRAFKQGDTFPACPKTGNETTWRHSSHQHQTGDRVTEAGQYIDSDGQRTQLNVGDTFPTCPKSGKKTSWTHS